MAEKQHTTGRRRRIIFWVLWFSVLMALNITMTELRRAREATTQTRAATETPDPPR